MMGRVITYAQAIREGISQGMELDPSIILMGMGITNSGEVFGTTEGLLKRFGPERVFETPISEAGNTGAAIGMAMMGKRVIITHQRVEFALLSLQQIQNASHMEFATNGQFQCPIVIRMIVGRGWGQGPDHGQSLESLFAAIPGLTVIYPFRVCDAKAHMLWALQQPGPVIFFEHRWLHGIRGTCTIKPEANPPYHVATGNTTPFRLSDVCIIAWGSGMVPAFAAAHALQRDGAEVDVINRVQLAPISQVDDLINHVRGANGVVIVDNGQVPCGIGMTLHAMIAEGDRPIITMGNMTGKPVPSSKALVKDYYVQTEDIIEAAVEVMGGDHFDMKRVKSKISGIASTPDQPHGAWKGPF